LNFHFKKMNASPISARRNAGNFLRLRHLRLLEFIADGGSLAAAARGLHLSQPAVTKMLQELETVFATTLVARGVRGGQLTDDGRLVLQRLKIALSHFEVALAGAESQDRRPPLRVGILPMVGIAFLPEVLRCLKRDAPPLRLEIVESNVSGLVDALLVGRLDCIMSPFSSEAFVKVREHDLTIVPVSSVPVAIACPAAHLLAGKRRITPTELQLEDWIVPAEGTDTRRIFDQLFLDHGLIPPRPVAESMSFHTNLHLVNALNALTLAPRAAILLYEKLGNVQCLEGVSGLPSRELSVVHLSAMASLPALKHLHAAVAASLSANAVSE
jgi:molybdate transport repressor ModE-like protein